MRKVSVLIVDDSEDLGNAIARLLESKGLNARAVTDGLQAINALKESVPEFIILDVRLPTASGAELAAYVRESFGTQVKMIALTSLQLGISATDETARRCDFFLSKPVDIARLEEILGLAP